MIFRLLLLSCMMWTLSSCAQVPMSGRGQQNLEDWDASMVYDPVTKRYYHTAKPRTMEEIMHENVVRDATED